MKSCWAGTALVQLPRDWVHQRPSHCSTASGAFVAKIYGQLKLKPPLLSLTGSFLVLLGPSNFTGPYLALLGHTQPYLALLSLSGPYWALQGLTVPY